MSRVLNIEATLNRIDNDLERLDQLYEIALEELPRWQARMLEKIQSGDCEQIRKVAHAYKGSSATLGAEHLQELLIDLEVYAKGTQIEKSELEQYFARFSEGVVNLIAAIKDYLANKPESGDK